MFSGGSEGAVGPSGGCFSQFNRNLSNPKEKAKKEDSHIKNERPPPLKSMRACVHLRAWG